MTKHHVNDSRLLNQPDVKKENDYFDYFYDAPGSEPGTLNIEPGAQPSRIVLIDYDHDHAIRKVDISPSALAPYLGTNTVAWVDVQGLGSEEILQQVGDIFKLHPLLLEDVVNVPQRPKVDDYLDQMLVTAHMIRLNPKKEGFETEQVSFVLGKQYLLTFQEEELEDDFELVRERIRSNQGKVRQEGPDYLMYLLIDSIIDAYFPVLEDYEDRIEDLETAILRQPSPHHMEKLYSVRRELLALRRLIWPLRNVMSVLIRGDEERISREVQIYLRDCYDHVIQVLDILETYRELASSLMELYLSAMSTKMNDVMKFLTVISTIFIPLTFIVGVYGMNFEVMPELKWKYGYFLTWGAMAVIALSLLYFFWRRGWLKSFYVVEKDYTRKIR